MIEALAMAELRGPTGPVRFGVVREGLYRGGQPSERHLALLRTLGVETIIDLRYGAAHRERAAARRLGMSFVHLPFNGVIGVGRPRLVRIVDAIRTAGRVYVHCHVGRDRTSLAIALYRVLVDGWDPKMAWQREAIDYGYVRFPWHAAINASYRAVTSPAR